MAIKRLNKKELINKCKDIFYSYLASNSPVLINNVSVECSDEYPSVAHILHKQYEDSVSDGYERISIWEEELSKDNIDLTYKELIREAIGYVKKDCNILSKLNMQNQKAIREETGVTDFMTSVKISLDKKINSYYDEFSLEVLFYDNVCTLNSYFNDYDLLDDFEERKEFIKKNTEVTHLGLVFNREQSRSFILIGLLGDTNKEINNSDITMLDSKFGDFANLRLEDLNKIGNNDLKQFFQEKIDMDKEKLVLIDSKNVRGDLYQIYREIDNSDLYIRYVCPSTGRVYYNKLNLRNLQISKYYESDDPETYIYSWWNITHMGAKVEGKPVVSC